MLWKKILAITLIILVTVIAVACSGAVPTSTVPPTPSITPPPTPTASYSQYQLGYLLLDKYPDIFWCDPDFYPIAREGQEQINALEQFPTIQSNSAEFSAILERLKLSGKPAYTDEEKLNIYREHKKLNRAVIMTPSGGLYNFSLRTGQNQGLLIEGTIDSGGRIKIQKQETSFNTCPICLTEGTLIDTPSGQIAVEQIEPGMLVWTVSTTGERVAAAVLKISTTPVPPSFQVVKISLNDGRTVTASPNHPTSEMKPVGDYQVGDTLDRGMVIAVEQLTYTGTDTYDLLPSGGTSYYWANGILLGSTLNLD